MRKKSILLCTLFIIITSVSAFGMTISPYDTDVNLAQSLVGSGITISNVIYTGAPSQSGYFTGGVAAGIGIESGIVLTSGLASNLHGTANTSDGISGYPGTPGDADLNDLIPQSTNDAAVLEFDFISATNAAYFSYVFGSDEYNEYVNSSYNDVFAFFDHNGDNVALIPGTTTAVSINNINNGLNWGYYNDNDPGPFPFEYDGFTDVFIASILGLTAGETYHLKLAIADAGDTSLDSGVFLGAESFSDVIDPDPIDPIPEPTTMLLFGIGLITLAGVNRRKR